MSSRGFAWFKRLLPMTRRNRVRLAQLDHTRAGMVMIAGLLRDLSARHDAHAHAIQRAARASRGALTEAGCANSIRSVFLGQTTDAALRSRQMAEALDGAVEALERRAAGRALTPLGRAWEAGPQAQLNSELSSCAGPGPSDMLFRWQTARKPS